MHAIRTNERRPPVVDVSFLFAKRRPTCDDTKLFHTSTPTRQVLWLSLSLSLSMLKPRLHCTVIRLSRVFSAILSHAVWDLRTILTHWPIRGRRGEVGEVGVTAEEVEIFYPF